MVKQLIYFLLFISSPLFADPAIEAFIDSDYGTPNQPIPASLIITHTSSEKIDSQTFKLNGQSFSPTLVREESMPSDPNLQTTIYSFQLPAQPKGLYVLPSIQVTISNKTYQSTPSSYEVKEANASLSAPKSRPQNTARRGSVPVQPKQTLSNQKPISGSFIFRLDAQVDGPVVLYPGQRTKLIYRILYRENLDLIKSNLPFVHAANFNKIGDVHIEDRQEGDTTVQEIVQEIEASKTGTFSFGPSSIEGYVYQLNDFGQKVYNPNLLSAEAPAVTLEVKSFPQPMPLSFTGGLGSLKIDAQLKSSSVQVGENVDVLFNVQGLSNLSDLKFPSLQCQPGFSGFFQLSDLPTPSEMIGDTKQFTLTLRPLTPLIHEIPSIYLTAFDPTTGQYLTKQSDALPITIENSPQLNSYSSYSLPFLKLSQWPVPSISPLSLNDTPSVSLNSPFQGFQTQWTLWLFPLTLLGFLFGKWRLSKLQQQVIARPKSEDLLRLAKKFEQIKPLEEALWWRLWETKQIRQGLNPLERVPANFYSLLFELQRIQYTSASFNFSELYHQTQQLLTSNPILSKKDSKEQAEVL